MPKLNCNMLVVEDNDEEIDRCKRAVSDENQRADASLEFILLVAKTANAAIGLLESHYIDCALVDLRIPMSEDSEDLSSVGNQLLRKMLSEKAVPQIVHSAHAGEMADDIEDFHVKVIEKEGGEYPEIFHWLDQQAPLIKAMQAIRQDLMKETAPLFHKSILPHWKDTEKYRNSDGDLRKIILRQIVSHLAEQLTLPLAGAPKHHLHEAYFRPPLREDRLHTGDILQYEGSFHVIVTPQCNMVTGYPIHFLLAKCRTMEPELQELAGLWEGSKKDRERANRKLRDKANQQVAISEHFLPPCGGEGPWMVEFKSVFSVPSDNAEALLGERIASMAPQFIPNLIQRFAAYLGRHGQPDLNVDELEAYLQPDR